MYFNEDSIIFYNGIFAHPKDISLDLYSQTFHYQNFVFEGIKSHNTSFGVKIFKAPTYYDGLKKEAEVMGIDFKCSSMDFVEITYELLKQNKIKDDYNFPKECNTTLGYNLRHLYKADALNKHKTILVN